MNKELAFVIFGPLLILSVLMGCQTIKDAVKDVPIPSVVITTTATTTTQPPMNVEYTKDFNWADAEKDNSIYIGGVEIRGLVNDNMMTSDAWITTLAKKSGAIVGIQNTDGSVTLTASSFNSPNNKYHFEGWRIRTDANPLTKSETIKLAGDMKGGTTRAYWRTIK